jgi:hypothetical protein
MTKTVKHIDICKQQRELTLEGSIHRTAEQQSIMLTYRLKCTFIASHIFVVRKQDLWVTPDTSCFLIIKLYQQQQNANHTPWLTLIQSSNWKQKNLTLNKLPHWPTHLHRCTCTHVHVLARFESESWHTECVPYIYLGFKQAIIHFFLSVGNSNSNEFSLDDLNTWIYLQKSLFHPLVYCIYIHANTQKKLVN